MNWGWSGMDDGWYYGNSLVPAGTGYKFNKQIGVLYGIVPPTVQAVAQIYNNQNFKIYPNPSTGKFTVESSASSGSWSVMVFNVLGERVYTSQLSTMNSQLSIDLSSQPKGVYVYKIITESNQQTSTGKLVIE